MAKVIYVSDLSNRIVALSTDIKRESNPKIKARLVDEQAAYKLVLLNLKQHEERHVISIKAKEKV